ncbi:MAG TPA: hypothetical protein PLM07_19680 [Candidatus Rifleibacterium sp.]|nr:hypothetical protein [Candidatus Rifleibacterium sp.]HPT48109.1 hypothetical protein [Candidatus Rifleibacterium sp.]
MLLEHCYNIKPTRKTSDLDLGVKVAGWDDFERLIGYLGREEDCSRDPKNAQRIYLRSVPVDIVPFGQISDDQHNIFWPPERAFKMSVLGFQEAYESSISIMLHEAPELSIKIPTLPGLALLKIISWNERFPERGKDALDLLLIMDNYSETGIENRLYQEESLLNEENFDLKNASIRLLGKDMAKLATSETYDTVKSILKNETDKEGLNRLANSMLSIKINYDNQLNSIMLKLAKLRQGFNER